MSEQKIQNIIIKLKPLFAKLWRHKWKLLFFNLIIMIISSIYLKFFVDNYYKSTVTILPEYGSKSSLLSQYSGLAAMAGIKVGESSPTEIYQNLVQSETVLSPVIYHKYWTKRNKYPIDLIAYYEIPPDEKLDKNGQKRKLFVNTFDLMNKTVITTDVGKMTKILTITVQSPEPGLSAAIVNNIVMSLDDYVRTKRNSFAKDQIFYIQKRITQVKDSLTICENKLEEFRDYNRLIDQSPQLLLEQSRLLRTVEILNTVYVELTKQLELAKIDEIKDTPILNVKEYARDPVVKAGPKRLSVLLIIMVFSMLISCGCVVFKDKIKKYYLIIKTT